MEDPKVVCMIPARMGSKRVRGKNTRLLGGIPLISHAIRAAKASRCFDEIYVNSESDEIGKIAEEEGVLYYKRPSHLSSDTATNDDFTYDFLKKIECDLVVQLLCTSPFVTPEEVSCFTFKAVDPLIDTLISVKENKIECVYKNKPINFGQKFPTPPSQKLEPIKAYAGALMGWKRTNFMDNMEKYGCAYHGGEGNIEFFTLGGFSEIDIDNEIDFEVAKSVWYYLNNRKRDNFGEMWDGS